MLWTQAICLTLQFPRLKIPWTSSQGIYFFIISLDVIQPSKDLAFKKMENRCRWITKRKKNRISTLIQRKLDGKINVSSLPSQEASPLGSKVKDKSLIGMIRKERGWEKRKRKKERDFSITHSKTLPRSSFSNNDLKSRHILNVPALHFGKRLASDEWNKWVKIMRSGWL